MDLEKNITITKKVNDNTYLKTKYNKNKILLETTLSTPTESETKIYNENGALTSVTIMSTLHGGETIETITTSSSTITYERRNDGSLKTIITTTPDGQVLKHDFDVNNTPLNNPYRIN